VPEAVVQEAVNVLQERRVFLELQLPDKGWTTQHCVTEFKRKSAMVMSAMGLTSLRHVTQVGKFSMKTRS
jgi:hypothetical protein